MLRYGVTCIGLLLLGCGLARAQQTPRPRLEHRAQNPNPSAAYCWLDVILEAAGRDVEQVGARPTIISRQMAIPLTAMYDAWAAYDDHAVGTRFGDRLRRPPHERTRENKAKAIAHAVHRTLCDQFPGDAAWLDEQMRRLGHDPGDQSRSLSTPQGVGNVVADAILAYRRNDGANQHGAEPGSNGKPYSDYTFYEPRNPVDRIIDPDRWQPLPFSDGKGGTYYPGFLTPHWYRVKPLALERSDQFRCPPVCKVGSDQLKREVDECIRFNATLSIEQKALVEFMRDGPRSTGQSGHWLQFAQDVSRRDHYDLDQDVKLFFAVGNTAFDAFIACWDSKRCYDSSRPWTLVRHLYPDLKIVGYLGPCKGVGSILANQWHPYSPSTFVTPPFPGYPSGHSTVSGACAKMLELFTGSDRFGAVARHTAGMYTETGCAPAMLMARDGQPATSAPATAEVLLDLPTFSATADLAGISRVMGGYHIQSDNVAGLTLGRQVAACSWPIYRAYFEGTAVIAEPSRLP